MDETQTTLTVGDLEAAHARFGAISLAYRNLIQQANAIVEAIGDEWQAADQALAKMQSKAGIDKPATGDPYTYDQRAELERQAIARLRNLFPWATGIGVEGVDYITITPSPEVRAAVLKAAGLPDLIKPDIDMGDPTLPQYHDHGPGRWCGANCQPVTYPTITR